MMHNYGTTYFGPQCQPNSCSFSPATTLFIYILHTRVKYSLRYNYLFIYVTSLTILHKTHLKHTFISTLSLIFTSQSHPILSGYGSQENLFYLKA